MAVLRRPLCCCAHRWQVTLPRWGTRLAWGTHCSSPCPGGAGPPKCQGASAVPEQVCPLGISMSLDPSHCGCEKDVCPWGCWQAGWVSLPQLGQQGPAHLNTVTQSSSRCQGVHQGACVSWFWLWVVDPKGAAQAHLLGDPPGTGPWCSPAHGGFSPWVGSTCSPKPSPSSQLHGAFCTSLTPEAQVWG